MQKLTAKRSGIDIIQEARQKLIGAITTQRISRFGVVVGSVLPKRCQTCQTSDATQFPMCLQIDLVICTC